MGHARWGPHGQPWTLSNVRACQFSLYSYCVCSRRVWDPPKQVLCPGDNLRKGPVREQVEYFLPPHAASVSPEAMDLLQQILVEDPVKRRGLKEIQGHPWWAAHQLCLPEHNWSGCPALMPPAPRLQ